MVPLPGTAPPIGSRYMAIAADAPSTSPAEVFDRILDKGVVIDVFLRISVGGIDLLAVDANIIVASIETYLSYADLLSEGRWPRLPPPM